MRRQQEAGEAPTASAKAAWLMSPRSWRHPQNLSVDRIEIE